MKSVGRGASVELRSPILILLLVALGCSDHPPVKTTQLGYRGLGMEQIDNPRALVDLELANVVPEPLPPVSDPGQPAGEVLENVEVLGHVGTSDFVRLMGAITTWVSPEQGCNYCHMPGSFAAEGVYTKTVSRRMIQMTQHINDTWKDHVGPTGVTCYTCHRGAPVPAEHWFQDPAPFMERGSVGAKAGQNAPAMTVGLTSLPNDPFIHFLADAAASDIRVQSTNALPTVNRSSIKQTEWTYALMVHMSESLGVNCTYCHNSRSFGIWSASSPARQTAWYGIRMVQDLNEHYLDPLASVLPANRKGPLGDSFKINCATCHQGAYKPLLGVSMLEDYPVLAAPGAPAASQAPAASEAPVEPEAPAESEAPAASQAPAALQEQAGAVISRTGTPQERS